MTASRVESISSALQRLARDTNEDIASRVASLEEERDRIDREIEKARRGQFERLTAGEAEERVQDVLNMAMAVPSDFAHTVRRSYTQWKDQIAYDLNSLGRSCAGCAQTPIPASGSAPCRSKAWTASGLATTAACC